jgi:hypothetical protein
VAEECLGDAVGSVDCVVVWVCAVGAGDPADVLSAEGFLELFGLPEVGGYLWWGDELVP